MPWVPRGSPQVSQLLCFSTLLALANAITLQDVCWDQLHLVLCLCQFSRVSLCASGTVSDASRKGDV